MNTERAEEKKESLLSLLVSNFKSISATWLSVIIAYFWAFALFSENGFWHVFGIDLFQHVGLTEVLLESASTAIKLLLAVPPILIVLFVVFYPAKWIAKKFGNLAGAITVTVIGTILAGFLFWIAHSFSNRAVLGGVLGIVPALSKPGLYLITLTIFAAAMSILAFNISRKAFGFGTNLSLDIAFVLFLPLWMAALDRVEDAANIITGGPGYYPVVSCTDVAPNACSGDLVVIGVLAERWFFWGVEENVVVTTSGSNMQAFQIKHQKHPLAIKSKIAENNKQDSKVTPGRGQVPDTKTDAGQSR